MNRFSIPKNGVSPFYDNVKRIPRKLKKKVKTWCNIHWLSLTNAERLWYYLEYHNIEYRDFMISKLK